MLPWILCEDTAEKISDMCREGANKPVLRNPDKLFSPIVLVLQNIYRESMRL